MFDGLNLTVDWYDIEITNMISVEPADRRLRAMLEPLRTPTGDPLHPACLRINRNPVSGGAAPTTVSYINAAFAKVAGVDVTADWRTDLAGGNFGVNFMVSSLARGEDAGHGGVARVSTGRAAWARIPARR